MALVALVSACAPATGGSSSSAGGGGAGIPTVPAALDESSRIDGLESLAVWHRGELVAERYLTGDADTLRDVRSVTKSVTSLLVGAALDDGRLTSIDRTLAEVAPDLVAGHGAGPAEVRVRDLLTMSTGLRWDEQRLEEYLDWRRAGDPIDHYLSRPLVDPPGSRFRYSSAASHLLGEVVAATTGSPLDTYAAERLFRPLGIAEVRWDRLADGSPNAASGLQLRTSDLVRIGRLVLDDGTVDGRQLISSAWIDESTRPHIDTGEGNRYGFQWWVEDDPVPLVVASGYGGQTLAVAPDHDLVVVATAAWNIPADAAGRQAERIVRYLRERLAPALLASGR